jgi:aminoglycoside/choline kinase family phosphotransferase
MGGLRSVLAATLAELYPGARDQPLAGDASTRRFYRLVLSDGGSRVVMDYGAPFEGETDDIRLTRIFQQAGLPVARVFQGLPEAGALILEDLGDDTLESALARATSGGCPTRDRLLPAAVRLAAEIATRGTAALVSSDRALGPALDAERFLFEMRFFLEHYVGGFLGLPDVAARIRGEVEAIALAAASHPRVLCHRDYHSRNIMVRADGELALVDIQDARWGPDTYDLASLLCDAYVDLGDDEATELSDLYWRLIPGTPDVATLRERFDIVAAQRMLKALGTFGYQVGVLGRDRYRSAIPRTVERLARILPTRAITALLGRILREEGLLIAGGSEPIE